MKDGQLEAQIVIFLAPAGNAGALPEPRDGLGHILQKNTFHRKPPIWRFFAFWALPRLPTFLDQIQQQVTFWHGGHRAEEYDVLLNRFLDFSCRHWLF